MTEIRAGVVEVLVLSNGADSLRTLALRRAPDARCPGAWETITGRIEGPETPPTAALREVREETGLTVTRLYNVTCAPFYLHQTDVVQVAVVFAAFAEPEEPIRLDREHDRAEWISVSEAQSRLTWPRSRAFLLDAVSLLGTGSAGVVEDVLRVV
jgi:dATP pyrophosphohydrolase